MTTAQKLAEEESEDLYPVLQLNDKFLELFDFFIVFPDSLNM